MRWRYIIFPGLFAFVAMGYVGTVYGQESMQSTENVCHLYGQASQGAAAWNKDDSCTIPHVELLDTSYRQNNFICCGGGATSQTTNTDIPAGLEVGVTGGHYWAVSSPRLTGNQFFLHTYCGPEPAPGPGCNVDVQVRAHYRVIPAKPQPSTNASSPEPKPSGKVSGDKQSVDKDDAQSASSLGLDKILAFAFGVLFALIMLFIAYKDRDPTPMGILIYRVVLALVAAGIGAVVPGMINVNVHPVIRAGGAIALFVIVYWFNPPAFVGRSPAPKS